MAACPSCNRPVAVARAYCLYCGAPLPAESVRAAEAAAASVRAASPSSGVAAHLGEAPAVAATNRWLLVVDIKEQSALDLARIFDLPAYEAGQRQRLGGFQLQRAGDEASVRAEADRLSREGVAVMLVPEADARIPPVLITGGEQDGGRLSLRSEAGPLAVFGRELFLIVQGPIVREYQSRAIQRKKPQTASLDVGYRFHLHRSSDPRPLELDPAGFSFGTRGAVAGSSLLELKAWLAEVAPEVTVDDGFKRLPPALAPAAPETGAAASLQGLGRTGSTPGKEGPLVLDNLAQFRFYSGWRAAVERRR
jgi:hypothetical protein